MKDVEKTNIERNNSSKRMRRRKRKMNLYGFIVVLLVLAAGITMCYTFLFNISEIRVSGESDQYTAEEIVTASGISKGDNLLRLNVKEKEQNILNELLYIETAEIDRDFPSSLEIKVSKCVPAYNIVYDNSCLLVSQKGKILADNSFITEGLPIFYGYEPSETTPGKMLSTEDEQKYDAFSQFIEQMSETQAVQITSVDMSDKYSILINYSNGIIFKMGNWTDIVYKLNMAQDVMQNENVVGKTGYITMIGTNQCSFRSSDEPAYVIGSEETTTEPVTDENGMIVTEPTTAAAETEAETTEATYEEPDDYSYDDYSYDDYEDDSSEDYYGYDDDYNDDDYYYYNDDDDYYYDDNDDVYNDDGWNG
jgi:cell division protein FtsQ